MFKGFTHFKIVIAARFLDHFKIALHRRLIFSAITDPLLKGLAHFKIVAPSVFFRSFQNRQACILIVFRESCSLAQRSNSFQDRHLPVFFEHFKIVRPSAFFLGGSAAVPKWAREFISKIDRPRSFSHRGSRKRVPRGSIRFSSGAAPGGWLPSRGTPTPGRLAHRGRLGAWLAASETADGSAVPGLRPGSCTSALMYS